MEGLTDRLMQEHKLILRYLDFLFEICRSEDQKAAGHFLIEKAGLLVGFFRTYADHFHHRKEENILFAELGQPGVLSQCNPVPQMLHEHEEGRRLLGMLEEGAHQRRATLCFEGARSFVTLLSEHIEKEDGILFPMAEKELSEAQKDRILKQFTGVDEHENMGGWQEDRYRVLLDNLYEDGTQAGVFRPRE